MKFFIMLSMMSLSVFGQQDEVTGMEERYGGHHLMMGSPMCLVHCSYMCMASAGKIETCQNLLNPENNTLAGFPDMAACPATSTTINDCFLNCGCQCTRCTICLMKKMNPLAAKEACKDDPIPMKCMIDKRSEAIKSCN